MHPGAVAHHGDAFGVFEHLFQPMGDVDDADAARAKIAHDGEEPVGFLLRQRSSRLVHQDNTGVAD